MSTSLKLTCYLVPLYLLWGMNWVIMKVANGYFPPVLFATLRFACGSAIMLLVLLINRPHLPARRLWPWIFAAGALQIAYNNVVMQLCLNDLGSGLCAVLNYTMPIFTALLAHLFLAEPLSVRKCLGIALSFLGLVLIMNIELESGAGIIIFALSGALAWAASGIIIKARLSHLDMISLTTWQMLCGAMVLCAYDLAVPQEDINWSWQACACLAYNAILASALAFYLWSYILTHMDASKAAVSILAIPGVGVMGGIIFMGESFEIHTACGMLLILLGTP